MKQKRYCLYLNGHLSIATKIILEFTGQSLAELIRELIIKEILETSQNLDKETQKFVLLQLKSAIGEFSDEELNPATKAKVLEILTLRLKGA